MKEFQELIKNFEKVRDYVRQFFVYGYKVRTDYDEKSARTYDNERRRIESWMKSYIKPTYTDKGKQVAISVNSKTIDTNPLYSVWKSKSFTDNDIMLHFFMLDLFADDTGQGYTVSEICDLMEEEYGVYFEEQTTRLKLKEYEKLGVLTSRKSGNKLYYKMTSFDIPKKLQKDYRNLLKFYQETAPFGFIGSTLLDRENTVNDLFCFKHHFLMHTLEDGVLHDVLRGMEEKKKITFVNKSRSSCNQDIFFGIPLRILVSTQTGRRYLCMYNDRKRRFANVRLDGISEVQLLHVFPGYDEIQKKLDESLKFCWGVTFGGQPKVEDISVKFYIDKKTEGYVLERLYREGRNGKVLEVGENTYLYSGKYFDTQELLVWLKTFTGRIIDIQGSNATVVDKIKSDFDQMYEMYGS